MKVDSAVFELLPTDAPPSPWVIRMFMQGEGFEDRVAPLVAVVGNVEVDVLRVSSDGARASGLLSEAPPEGAPLRIGYLNEPELSSTDITFHLEQG